MENHPPDDRALDPRIEIGHVQLVVADLDRSLAFYQGVLGFTVTRPPGQSGVFLTAGHHPLFVLNGRSAGLPGPPAGASRFAIRYPDRPALGDALRRLTAAGVSLDGALDHGVSEALYLRDPDGNGLELYYERRLAAPAPGPVGGPLPLDVDALRIFAEAVPPGPDPSASLGATPPLSEVTRERLREVRLRLLDLHKVLLEDTKTAYELDRGRIASNATLLQLVISDPWFAWLHPLSELVVRIDETVQPEGLATEADGAMLLDQVERLLSPPQSVQPFAQRYSEALQRQPAVILAHGDVRRVLKQAK